MKRLLFLYILFSVSNYLMAQWVQTNGPLGGGVGCISSIDTMLFVGTEDGVFRSADDGASWNPTSLENIIVISLATSNTLDY